MNNTSKIININEIYKRKELIYNAMVKEVQEKSEQQILKKRAALEMKYLKPELIKMNQKKIKYFDEQIIKPDLIMEDFKFFIFELEDGKKDK